VSRTDLQLLRAAIGDDSLPLPERMGDGEGRFHLYQVKLPLPRYRGLPPVWSFAVAGSSDRSLPAQEREAFLTEARELIRKHLHPSTPLVLVCEDPAIRLNDKLRFDGKNVFFVDEHMLPSGREISKNHPRSAAFIAAVRGKLDAQDLSTVLFDPYQPEKPATGWRFFGRRRELDRLVGSDENFFVVGSRKIGKTSLLNAVRDQLLERGEAVYWPKIQHLSSAQQVVDAILQELSVRDIATAQRRKKVLNEDMLASVLRTMSARKGRITLILDEVGNVVFKNSQEDWRLFGILREFSHSGRLRVIMSGFQEFFIKQRDDFTGPFVNFAGVMRLGGFQDPEIDELLVEPLKLWGRVEDDSALRRMVIARVGRHPYFLQFLGQAVFRTMFERRHPEAQSIVEDLLRGSLEIFQPPTEALFLRIRSAALRYLFLKRCHEAAAERAPVDQADLTDEWMERSLADLDYPSTVAGRSWILDELQMRGLTVRVNATGSRQRVALPVIYSVMNESETIERYLAALARDIVHERRQLLYGPSEEAAGGA
jgi:AAA domain-containing protein